MLNFPPLALSSSSLCRRYVAAFDPPARLPPSISSLFIPERSPRLVSPRRGRYLILPIHPILSSLSLSRPFHSIHPLLYYGLCWSLTPFAWPARVTRRPRFSYVQIERNFSIFPPRSLILTSSPHISRNILFLVSSFVFVAFNIDEGLFERRSDVYAEVHKEDNPFRRKKDRDRYSRVSEGYVRERKDIGKNASKLNSSTLFFVHSRSSCF